MIDWFIHVDEIRKPNIMKKRNRFKSTNLSNMTTWWRDGKIESFYTRIIAHNHSLLRWQWNVNKRLFVVFFILQFLFLKYNTSNIYFSFFWELTNFKVNPKMNLSNRTLTLQLRLRQKVQLKLRQKKRMNMLKSHLIPEMEDLSSAI